METFTILTTEANESIATVHDRMPVILPAEAARDMARGPAKLAQALLVPYRGPVSIRAVSKLVGNPRNDTPEVLADA